MDIFICSQRCKKNKSFKYCDGRFIAVYLIRKIYGKEYSYKKIAVLLGKILKDGNGDHAATIYAENVCDDFLKGRKKDFDGSFLKNYKRVEMEVLKEIGNENNRTAYN